jgi:hypothetical protein
MPGLVPAQGEIAGTAAALSLSNKKAVESGGLSLSLLARPMIASYPCFARRVKGDS